MSCSLIVRKANTLVSDTNSEVLQIVIDGFREMADKLDAIRRAEITDAPRQQPINVGVFDPDTDTPPVTPSPDPRAPRIQQDWCGLMLFAGLWAWEVRRGRGATASERLAIAQSAGYRDNRAWTGGWTDTWEDDAEGRRTIASRGKEFLDHYYKAVGRTLPDDLAL